MALEWLLLFAGVSALSAAGFVIVAAIWLRKLRETILASLGEVTGQQILAAQHANESIAQLQKQQDYYSKQINALTQTELRLQREISSVTYRLKNTQGESLRGGQTLH